MLSTTSHDLSRVSERARLASPPSDSPRRRGSGRSGSPPGGAARLASVALALVCGCELAPVDPAVDGGAELFDASERAGDAGAPDAGLEDDYGDAGLTDVEEPEDPPDPPPPDEPEVMDEDPSTGARTVRATYRVLQWNIAGGKVHDCRTAGITAAVRRFVMEHHIDFVGLNEVCPAQYDSIREALRTLWGKPRSAEFSAFVGDGTPRIVGNAIFSRHNLDRITRQELGEDRYGKRNLLCGRVANRPHLRFCSTHLSPGAGSRVQLRRAHERLERWWTERRDTVILTGDFNLEPNDRAFDAIYAPQASHPAHNPDNSGHYHELDDDDADHCRGYGERSGLRPHIGACGEGRKIDLIFVRRSRIHDGRTYGADAMNVPNTCGGLCSDHRPVRGWVRALVRVD